MRFVVVDASVAVKWYVNEVGSEQAIALLDEDDLLFLAPDIFLAEVVNALLRQRREGQLDDQALDKALSDIHFSAPELVSTNRLMGRAAGLARALAHPIYDCLYLALAERWDTVLVTADGEFVSRCRQRLTDDLITERLCLLNDFEL
jgi:predicted nucleic acid-binding protein